MLGYAFCVGVYITRTVLYEYGIATELFADGESSCSSSELFADG